MTPPGGRPVVATLDPQAKSPREPGRLPLILGHRGAMALEPENTLASFERAVRDGADGVEFDVRLSADGQVIVFHDGDLGRLCGDGRHVADLSWDAIRQARLSGGHRIPLLQEVLDFLPRDLLVNVELKADGVEAGARLALVQATAAVLRPARTRNLIVSSFEADLLLAWPVPEIRCGFLFDTNAESTPGVKVAAVHPHHLLCTPARVAAWQGQGLMVNTWTVNDEAHARALVAMQVDAIMTDDPARLRRFLA